MTTQHVVVDGSNIATEGRDHPSLGQLESALAELQKDLPEAEFTVVVDATFAHRIDESERPRYDELTALGQLVSPPAGAIGRGDAFLLRIAERIDATVLSNDSFQEFHGEHPWLFERGRLLGATPVPGVGFIFSPRQPVRGPRSRVATRDASRSKRQVERAIEAATKEAVDPAEPAAVAGAKASARPPQAVNDPTTFIRFIASHPLGSEIEGVVERFTSHGAVVRYGEVECYAPLSQLADPPPKSVREVLRRGETRTFVLTALDPHRRGVELAIPGVASVSGRPTDETVAAEVGIVRRRQAGSRPRRAPERPTPTETPVAQTVRARRRSPGQATPPFPSSPEPTATTAPTAGGRRRRTARVAEQPPAPASAPAPAVIGRRLRVLRRKVAGEVDGKGAT